ncbi:hypothetical protein [Seonamhaeicola marinus]|uniref:Lipoprotein n=1 Tax=Seonamhaeicola marinus TaxID=1912246 RepID=A0A5D0HUA8_9FLAO|nr:hypothetical protein [Seonamhaeicola marinus]TYA74954.1 hypothetical protein FUA24_16780 [Seonamhaeicola marinus]
MRYRILTIAFLSLIVFGCKSKDEEKGKVADHPKIIVEQEKPPQKTIALGDGLEAKLQALILEYAKEYPIKKISDNEKAVHQSYYVSFFTVNGESMLAICRQSFVFELFPDFAFSNENMPNKKPTPKGILKGSDLPVIIFDTDENIGSPFYDVAHLNSEIPNKYYAEEEVSHDNSIPPIFTYKIDDSEFQLAGRSKSQRID